MKGRHVIRGALGGLLLGVAIGILLTIYRVILFGSLVPLGIAILGLLLGTMWAFAAPGTRRSERQPARFASENTRMDPP